VAKCKQSASSWEAAVPGRRRTLEAASLGRATANTLPARPFWRLGEPSNAPGRRWFGVRPAPVLQQLVGPELRLVGHLGTLGDPVAEVHVRQLQLPGLLDLPQH